MGRPLMRIARDLASAVNKLKLAQRNADRDAILSGVYAGTAKGAKARARYEAAQPVLDAYRAEAVAFRAELAKHLDAIDKQSSIGP